MSVLPAPITRAPMGFADDLGRHGASPALVTGHGVVTYAELDRRVDAMAARLGPTRRLVVAAAANTVEAVVAYLGALRGGHPVALVPAGDAAATAAVVDRYDADVIVDGDSVIERRPGTAHDLHPDLALLLSTSGSTGTAKVVRLSHENLDANAAAIAEYLGLTANDSAITSLPLHYCYGLSVLNSHLHAGASVVLTELSVVDSCFWDRFRTAGATSFAGVPHTFALLDRVGFDRLELPTLRYVTQAGGRLHRDAVRRYAHLGAARGWDLVVMYGQTEATARMAYLPPALAATHPDAIGVAIPGGALTIEDPGDDGTGELVYRGANVMLGYAHDASDLRLGRTVDALRTGDLGRRNADGLIEITGRRSRFVKPFGVRVDLDDLERRLAADGLAAACAGNDEHLVVAVEGTGAATTAAALVDELVGLPRSHRSVVEVDRLPRLATGKPDHPAILGLAAPAGTPTTPTGLSPVHAAFAEVLGADEPDDADTFVSLGGDSLSFVEMSVRLEAILGELPDRWHVQTVGALAARRPRPPRRWMRVDTSVVIRAVATLLVVGTHADLWEQPGGAHALLAVAGFNFGRFQIDSRHRWASIARLALPSACFLSAMAFFSGEYGWPHAVFLNGVLARPDAPWAFWFVETLLQLVVVLTLVLAVPAIRRVERRQPFLFAAGIVAVGLVLRFHVLFDPQLHHRVFRPQELLWLFALGWAGARARTVPERLLVTATVAFGMQGFFAEPTRGVLVALAVAAVTWLPMLRIPRVAVAPVTTIAGASLYIYLTHMPLHLPIERTWGAAPAFIVSLVVGVAACRIADQRFAAATRFLRRASSATAPRPEPVRAARWRARPEQGRAERARRRGSRRTTASARAGGRALGQ